MADAHRITIGIDSFTYHRYFGELSAWEEPIDVRWTTADFIRRAVELGVDAVSLQTVFLPELTDATIGSLRAALDDAGLDRVLAWGHRNGLEGGTNAAKVESLRRALPAAKALGCQIVRLVAGDQFFFALPVAERMERLVPILRAIGDEAAALGLTLALENHADFRMRDLVSLMERVDRPNVGICFCAGNAVRVGDDLLEAARLAAPWARMAHVRDLVVRPEWQGDPTKWWPAAPLGRGDLDIAGFVDVLRSHDYHGTLFVEMANMYRDWPDEDAAVAESVGYLRRLLARI